MKRREFLSTASTFIAATIVSPYIAADATSTEDVVKHYFDNFQWHVPATEVNNQWISSQGSSVRNSIAEAVVIRPGFITLSDHWIGLRDVVVVYRPKELYTTQEFARFKSEQFLWLSLKEALSCGFDCPGTYVVGISQEYKKIGERNILGETSYSLIIPRDSLRENLIEALKKQLDYSSYRLI